jgi:putative tryptophan/tyrosine transport system substrate-binding protein
MTKLALAWCPQCGLLSGLSAASLNAAFEGYRQNAQALGVSLIPLDINADTEFAAAVAFLKSEIPGGVLLIPHQINAKLRGEWAAAQASLRIPLMSDYRSSGCVLAYGPDYAAMFRRIAEFVARILNGAQAGDLPMEQPTK